MTGSVNPAVERATDGVVPELARDDLERNKVLSAARTTIGSGVAPAALGAFIAACGGSSSSFSAGVGATGVAGISSTSTSAGPGSGEAKSPAMLGDQKAQHVKAPMTTIKAAGGTQVKKPTFAFPVSDQASFLEPACTLENVGVGLLVHPPAAPTGAFDAAPTKPHVLANADPLIKKG